ncbi:MAG: bifunctional (p)ppGpp synthetase/guanosine-3',5'-bis(diphosphate) 3'-pyrophosphohydrolase [Marinilabiliaceae bacterium]|nr:bifunctional (p)ppGpp synthetase/guanosine-3',5'-bis(diphosphate) 3'-pyrophosphohydrolase [Marinilabiliaceae bacterium]
MEQKDQILIEERAEIISKYRALLRSIRGLFGNEDIAKIRKAIETAIQLNPLLRRPSGELSIVHTLEVAKIVVEEIGLGRTSIICALLYDLVQVANISVKKIGELFGKQEEIIVDGLVKVAELYSRGTSIENENFRKLLLTFAQDLRVVLIIIAERLLTMRKLAKYDPESQLKISSEVAYLYAPIAHRLGLYVIKSEMEDLVMKFTNREMYSFIAKKLNDTKRARDKYINEFIEPLKKELDGQGLKFEIKGRTKTIHSIYNKMKKQNHEFEQVYDLFAIRVILDSNTKNEKADCWKVYSIVTDMYRPNPSRMRDWISIPKSNGYESLHTTVLGPQEKWVEVQIRTRRMDDVAEHGLAAHWKYKGGKSEKGMDQWLSNIREVLENPEVNAIDFIDDFKLNLYDEEVFVFTPKGDLIRMPKGATVLDFAFEIHSNIGKKCVGAIVNQRNVPIKHKLRNGDTIEIKTSINQVPKKEWLNIVVTSKAKGKLKQSLKEIQYKEAEYGRETLIRRLKNAKVELTDQLLHQLVKQFKYKTVHDFYYDISIHKLDFQAIRDYLFGDEIKSQDKESVDSTTSRSAENFVVSQINEDLPGTDILVIERNLKNIEYKLAKCCNPIFGDEIFGFVSVTGGIKIHRKNCPNANEMYHKFGYRIIKAQWASGKESEFSVSLKVTGSDDIGIISNISFLITKELKLKLRSISIDSHEGIFEGNVSVFINNTSALNVLMKKIKGIKGVYSVSRIENR